MNKNMFWIVFLFIPIAAFSQEYILLNTEYNKAEKWEELTIEIVNKSDGSIGIPNAVGGRFISFFELYFYDKNGQLLPVSYYPPSFGVPFCNGLEIPTLLTIEPHTSLTFKYSTESLFRLCKTPDRITQMKIRYYIKYAILKDEKIIANGIYDAFSQTISLEQDKKSFTLRSP